MKKKILLVFSFLLMSTLFIFSSKAIVTATSIEVENELEVDPVTEMQPAAACKSLSLEYISKNTITKEVVFRVIGTPGNMVSVDIYKFLSGSGPIMGTYTYLGSSGVEDFTFTVPNGSYEAVANQYSPCDGGTSLFFTMN